jgi:NADH:ubiquinone oxidoreductase subunit H
MLNLSLSFFLILIPLYVAVAFLTLLERKILGFSQLRLGPNKTSIYGLLQPFSDAIKLFLKILSVNHNSNKMLFLVAPCLIFFLISII